MISLYKYFLILMVLITGLISSISDIKSGKIYNRNLGLILLLALPIVVLNFLSYESFIKKGYVTNLSICVILSLLLYKYRIWAAGDAKLISTIVFLLPYDFNRFFAVLKVPGIYLFSLTFSLAYIYVIGDSIYRIIKKPIEVSTTIINSEVSKKRIGLFFMKWLFGVIFGNFAFKTINLLFPLLSQFNYVIYIILFFIVSGVYSVIESSKHKAKIFFLLSILLLIWGFFTDGFKTLAHTWVSSLIIVIIIMMIKFLTEIFNYEEIELELLEKGMVLSYESCLILNSFELSIFTDETTRSRLSEEDANSIIKSGKKKGVPKIRIVRLMPFSIFIFLGVVIYLIIGRI